VKVYKYYNKQELVISDIASQDNLTQP